MFKGLNRRDFIKKASLATLGFGVAGYGGKIVMGSDGKPTGYLQKQAETYTRSLLDNDNLYTVDMAKANMAKIEQQLLSEGYTMYLDGYSSYFFNDVYYRATRQFEQNGDMNFVLGLTYEMFLENERGSIKIGKYADFLLVNKDILSCPVKDIHNAKPSATYFEGKKVFSA